MGLSVVEVGMIVQEFLRCLVCLHIELRLEAESASRGMIILMTFDMSQDGPAFLQEGELK
jgi:hypothetical protein